MCDNKQKILSHRINYINTDETHLKIKIQDQFPSRNSFNLCYHFEYLIEELKFFKTIKPAVSHKTCQFQGKHRALDKRDYLAIIRDNYYYNWIKSYVVTLHLNRLDETVQMRGHNIWFR